MSPEVALLDETWEIVRSHIPAKERLEVAESLVRTFEENIGLTDIQVDINEFDKVMKTAIMAHFEDFEEDDDEEDDDWG